MSNRQYAEKDQTLAMLERIDDVLEMMSPDAMRWTPDLGPREHEDQCDESCHEAGLGTCPKCDTLIWELVCDSCRFYAAQDGGS